MFGIWSGSQRRQYESWRAELLGCLAHVEALIDFGEDAEDITSEALCGAIERTVSLRALIDDQLGEAVTHDINRATGDLYLVCGRSVHHQGVISRTSPHDEEVSTTITVHHH